MKKYDIKPVRIRFSFGSNECTTLEQFRISFSPKAVYDSFPQLLKWLGQNNNMEIKESLEANQKQLFQKDELSLFLLYSIFFHSQFETRNINNLSDLCLNWYSNPEKDTNSFKYLCKEIIGREWGFAFFLKISSTQLTGINIEEVKSQNDIYDIYKFFCAECDKFEPLKNLSDLYLYFALGFNYSSEFTVLDKKIREFEWKHDFFLDLLPNLYDSSCNNQQPIVKYSQIRLPICSSEDLFKLYDFFLHDIIDKNHVHSLIELYALFLFDYGFKSINTQNLHSEISRQKWCVSFYSNLIQELIKRNHWHNINNRFDFKKLGLSDGSVDDLFEIYSTFLNNYLLDNNINNLEDLYSFWSSDKKYVEFFTNLQEQIVKTKWGTFFLNNNVKRLLVEFNEHGDFSESKTMIDIDESHLFSFFCLHFGFYLSSNDINNISDLFITLSKDKNFTNCFDCLEKVLYQNLWGIEIVLSIYKKRKNHFKREQWLIIIKQLEKFLNEKCQKIVLAKGLGAIANIFSYKNASFYSKMDLNHNDIFKNLFLIAKYYIDDFENLNDGYNLMTKLEKDGYKKACDYLNIQRTNEYKISRSFAEKYLQWEKKEWEKKPYGDEFFVIDEKLQAMAKTLHEKWVLNTQSFIHKIASIKGGAGWERLERFVDLMRELDGKRPNIPLGYALDCSEDSFFNIFTSRDYNRDSKQRLYQVAKLKSKSYLELQFLYALLGLFYGSGRKEASVEILNSLEPYYIPAKEIVKKKNIPVSTSIDFNKLMDGTMNEYVFRDILKDYCKNLVNFVKD